MRRGDRIVVGVDAGASNIKIVTIDLEGSTISHKIYPSMMVGSESFYPIDDMCRNIALAIKDTLNNGNLEPLTLGIGFAGAIDAHVIEAVKKCISEILGIESNKIFVFPDYIAAHMASFTFRDGVVGILGTGSIVYGKYKGRETRIGGWGHLLGDEGSAYRLGLHAIRSYLLFLEGRAKETKLHTLIKSRLGTESLEDVLKSIYLSKNPKKLIASLAPEVFTAAREGDDVAKEIIEKEMGCFAEQIVHASKKLGMDKPLISLTGAVYENNEEMLKPMLTSMLRKMLRSDVTIETPAITPPCASALIAVKRATLEDLMEPLTRICKKAAPSLSMKE